jgi:hypothetical protein
MEKTTMTKEKILALLKERPVPIEFKKVNGEVRFMLCTLKAELIPPTNTTLEGQLQEEERKRENPDVLAVWSVEDFGWRSFRWENLLRVDDIDLEGQKV